MWGGSSLTRLEAARLVGKHKVEVVVESGMMVTRVEAEGGSVLMADMLTGC